MIEGLTGKVGSGKTLKAVSDIVQQLQAGGCAGTNITLDRDNLAKLLWKRGTRFRDRQLIDLPMKTDPCFQRYLPRVGLGAKLKILVFIDEAHLFFPAAEYRNLRNEFLSVDSYVSQSRKVGHDIFFITQAWENVWGQLRKHALFETRCRDFRVVSFPLFGSALGQFMGLKWSRVDTASGQVLGTGSTALDPAIFEVYSTCEAYNLEMDELMANMPVFDCAREEIPRLFRLLGPDSRIVRRWLERNP